MERGEGRYYLARHGMERHKRMRWGIKDREFGYKYKGKKE